MASLRISPQRAAKSFTMLYNKRHNISCMCIKQTLFSHFLHSVIIFDKLHMKMKKNWWRQYSKVNGKITLPLWLHMYLGQWFCMACLGCRSKVGLYECPAIQHTTIKTDWKVDATLMNSPPFPSLTALSESDSVCRMSNMVLSTRPLHNKWGKLRKEKTLVSLLGMNLHFKTLSKRVCALFWVNERVWMHSHVSARPDKYLSATLRILLWMWLKLTKRNWAWRSSSSSWALVFGWKYNILFKIRSAIPILKSSRWCHQMCCKVQSLVKLSLLYNIIYLFF